MFPTTLDLHIAGVHTPASGDYAPDVNPTTGEISRLIGQGTPADAHRAVEAASKAQTGLASMLPIARATCLLAAAAAMEADAATLAAELSDEMGKPLVQAEQEIHFTVATFRAFAALAWQPTGDVLPSLHLGVSSSATRVPRGVVAAIAPWNYPYLLTANKVGAAIISGDAVVIKPSPETPLTGIRLAEYFSATDLPAGSVNCITGGAATAQALITDPAVRVVALTGGTDTGRAVAALAGQHLKKAVVELGGKAPFLVFQDADITRAVDAAVWGKVCNAGQICMATDRLILHADIAEQVTTAVTRRLSEMVIGSPLDPATNIGPLVNAGAVERINALVEDARSRGATVLTGGAPLDHPDYPNGHFYPPTVILNPPADARISVEEVFGPVLVIETCHDESEMIERANSTEFGLGSAVWTSDLNRALRVSTALTCGKVHINDTTVYDEPHGPHGGTGNSGLGREGGTYSLDDYTDWKWTTINTTSDPFPLSAH
ncbi:aldehyde dehydrogenase [Rhodococcus sp. UFZ-B548]|uniref:aldehyde dehydrogenase family protein n=1 Tax=Rhodococcus sp. UFZ-B548 TaxID=2742212 RepID=UPI0015F61B9C|nr:aldehyde dehydrogenase family protein [Rhodococcus sp. UFZ-B548]